MKAKNVTEQIELDETVDVEDITELAEDSSISTEDSVSIADVVVEATPVSLEVVEEITPSNATDTSNSDTIGEVVISIEKSVKTDEPKSAPNTRLDNAAVPVPSMTNEASSMINQSPNNVSSNEKMEDWIVMPESAWPPPIFMNKTASAKEQFYLQHRWHSQWAYYDKEAAKSKKIYYRLQYIVVIGSLIIPALISLNSNFARFITDLVGGGAGFETTLRIGADVITVFISWAVAGAAAIESLKKYGENWNSYRSAAEELQAEKNYYDMAAGPYASNPNPFSTFVDRIEGIVANQNGKYFQAVQKQLAKQESENEEIIASFKSGDDDDEYALSVQRQSSPSPEPSVEDETVTATG